MVSSLNPVDEALSVFAERQAIEVGKIADQIEQVVEEGDVAVVRIPTSLTWKRRNFAGFEHLGMIDRLYAVAVAGLVAGPFAIYNAPQAKIRGRRYQAIVLSDE